jgi:asparagine synthase (glutamine-hydrolysing)
MCGFSGFFSTSDNALTKHTAVTEAFKRIVHRGPDAQAIFTHPKAVLAHARLAIIDPSERSDQPMVSACKRFVLVYNGEVYNYRTLRENLRKKGVEFATEGDTEVVLNHLIEFGSTGIAALNGCFALAFVDLQSSQLLLARDRMGINPLWYTVSDDGIYFASEMKGLPIIGKKHLNRRAIRDVLEFSYNPENEGFINGFFRLPPGCLIEYPGAEHPKEWFNLNDTFMGSEKASLRSALENAVRDRLIADTPIGCFLSGGIDSSIISALAARNHRDLATFSVGFSEFPHADESAAAQRVAKHIHSRHEQFNCTLDDLAEHTDKVFGAFDDPFADSSAIATSFLSERTAKHVKVALSGDGADELFGGYRKHKAHALAHALPRWAAAIGKGCIRAGARTSPSKLAKFFTAAEQPNAERYFAWARFTDANFVQALFPNKEEGGAVYQDVEASFERYPPLQAVLYSDQRMVLPGDMLTKVDLMSMHFGLEVRVPFLDSAVMLAANSLSVSEKYNRLRGKIPLRNAFADLLPPETFTRKKQGFEVPLNELLRTALTSRIERLVQSEVLIEAGFSSSAVAMHVHQFNAGQRTHLTLLYTLICIDDWLRRYATHVF